MSDSDHHDSNNDIDHDAHFDDHYSSNQPEYYGIHSGDERAPPSSTTSVSTTLQDLIDSWENANSDDERAIADEYLLAAPPIAQSLTTPQEVGNPLFAMEPESRPPPPPPLATTESLFEPRPPPPPVSTTELPDDAVYQQPGDDESSENLLADESAIHRLAWPATDADLRRAPRQFRSYTLLLTAFSS